MTVHIEVPGTLSNLGPGYDVLGMAIDRTNGFIVEVGEGASPGSELVLLTAQRAAERFGGVLPPLQVIQHERVPRSRGLGSSATARVAGLLAYEHFVGPVERTLAVRFLAEEEGHPDNVAPALLGGLVVCGARPVRLPIAPVGIALCIPAIEVSTPLARRALPATIAHGDAVETLGALGQLLAGLVLGDLHAIRAGVHDRVHQPYRAPLIGPVYEAFEAAVAAGGAPFISGSGSTLAAFVHTGALDVAEALAGPLRAAGIPCATHEVQVRDAGATTRGG